MSNSLDSFLTRIGDVTIERVTPRGNSRPGDPGDGRNSAPMKGSDNSSTIQSVNDRDSEETGGETSDGEHERKMEMMAAEDIEEIHSEGSGDDMDLDETIDTKIGVRMDSERQHSESSCPDDDVETVNILDTLPLEGAPIEGQEVTEADLLGKPLKEDDGESIDNDKSETQSGDEEEDGSKRRTDSDESDPAKKKQKKDDSPDDSECELKTEKKLANMRRNIREVMDETQLDEATLAAQRQEMERLRRVQEQQKIIREVQRQIAFNRQNKNQTRVISLLQGKQNDISTSISQSSPSSSSSQVKLPNTVLLKVNSGSGTPQTPSGAPFGPVPRRPVESTRWQKGRGNYPGSQTSISRVPHRSTPGHNVLQQRIRMMTPSVSISPVVPKKEPCDRSEYFSDSEVSEAEVDDIVYEKPMHTIRKPPSTPKQPRPPKGKDVVTISSSSESSDDDCIVLSDPSGGEETDNDDDPSNSGMHTNDRYNVPDEHGRVLVNVGHPDTEPDVYLAPQVARVIKPHQIGGIRFLFDNIIESIERYKNSAGFGCILAHSMGLGKTLQVASFCDIFFRCTSAKTVLCIMPINTLQNWLAEFNMWLPYEDPNAVKLETVLNNSKSESCADVKHEIKEENSNLTDVSSGMSSRPISRESAHRPMQDNASQISNMMSTNSFNNQPYENHNSLSNYYQDNTMNKTNVNHNVPLHLNYGNIPHNSMYHQGMGHVEDYKPLKSEIECQDMNKTSGQLYRGIDNQNASMYPMMNNQTQIPSYPGYQNPPGSQSYGNNPSVVQVKQEIENEPMRIKEEPKEPMIKEENVTSKEETSEEKKIPKIPTPYSVDSPVGMDLRPRHFRLHILNDSHKTMAARAKVIHEWQKVGGVLLIGYELYRQLSLKKPNKAKRKRGQPFKDIDVEEEDKNKGLLDEMHGALVNPGPDLVICDEGHRIKNSHASISLALKQMRTKRRIVLTGYPLQNNLLEYWCMVDFVRPNYLGTKSEFCNMFERPIQNGQCIDSTPQDIRLMRYRAHVLHALLEGFVQRRSHSVLQVSLPRKEEYILLVRMTPHQRNLYDTFMNQVVKTRAVPNPLKAFAVCCKIWNHPDILFHFLRKRQANEEDDLDLEETIAEKATPGGKRSKARQPKGESKKGKKVNVTIKNKPAASVPPNSSSSSTNESTPTENTPITKQEPKENFTNQFTQQISNSNFNNSGQQTSFSQDYQNYRPNDQNNYYRNDQPTGEYNGYYNNNQNQQRFSNQDSSFPPYQQNNVNYNSTQNYPQNQTQTFNSSNDQNTNNSPQKYSNTSSTDFNTDQNNANNYDIFQKQSYCYQDQGRNYQSNVNQPYPQNANQPSNYETPTNQSTNMSMTNYSSYGQSNQSQNYLPTGGGNNMQQIYPRNENQPIQNQSIGYSPNQQSQSTPQPSTTQTSYINNQGLLPMQQNTNQMIPNSVHPYTGPSGRANQPPVPIQNTSQTNQSSNQLTTNISNQNQPLYPPNQATPSPMIQNQSHGYINNQQNQSVMSQGQVRGYSAAQQNRYPTPQTSVSYQSGLPTQGQVSQTQTHEYTAEQPTTPSKHGFSSGHHSSTGGSQNTYPISQQCQTPTPTNQNAIYSGNQQTPISPMPNQPLRYPSIVQNQTSMPQNQAIAYPSSTTPAMNQNESQNFSGHYQMNQNQQQNPGMSNYSESNTQNQYKAPDNNYSSWQGNYSQPIRPDQCNDQYFREPNTNRYDNNYFPQQNYVQNPYDYNSGHSTNMNPIPNKDNNISQPVIMDQNQAVKGNFDKMNKDASTSVGIQSQPLTQNNVNPSINFNSNDNNSSKQNMTSFMGNNNRNNSSNSIKEEEKEKDEAVQVDKEKEDKSDDEILTKDEEKDTKLFAGVKEEMGIPYDWATELMKGYVPGLIDASAKMTLFFCILEKAICVGDRVLAFSQSLFTLNLIEDFLARNDLKYADGQTEGWVKNVNYYRLDGSTSALEREKLINEFNQNPKIHLFLVSTRAGSLGINLVGANRAIVFDASWNPCHDTQAVCRVYRYGQQKPCYVYRLVTDNCLERKIYDRQISKQGMADRVVDQCNPDAHLSLKEATTLSWEWEEDSQVQDFSSAKNDYSDEIMHHVLEKYSSLLTKQPFHHESLLVDRKDKKLSQAEKRLARRGYELEKMAATCSKPSYNYVPGNTATRAGGLQIRAIRGGDTGVAPKPVASVRPMQQRGAEGLGGRGIVGSRWIPAEVWQRQGMSAQEMTLPLDVVIPTNSPDKSSIVLKAGQRVMVLKSPKGIYMQLESGKIIAIRTALKINQQKREEEPKKAATSAAQRNSKPEVGFPLRNNSAISIIPKTTNATPAPRIPPRPNSGMGGRQHAEKDQPKRSRAVGRNANSNQINLTQQVSLQRVPKNKHDSVDHSLVGDNSNSSDSQPRTDQRVEEVRLEDVVAEANSNPDYSPSNQSQAANSDSEPGLQKSFERKSQDYGTSPITAGKHMQNVPSQRVKTEPELISKHDKNMMTPYDSKECENSLPTANYGNQYSRHISQNPSQNNSNEEVTVEEHSTVPPLPSHSTQMMQQQQQQQQQQMPQENCQSRSLLPPQSYIEKPPDLPKGIPDSNNSSSIGPNLIPKDAPDTQEISAEESHRLPQAYPYSQYPRYYDYTDPRSRNLSTPYGSYFPNVPSHSANTRPTEVTKSQPEIEKSLDERTAMPVTPAAYSQSTIPVTPASINTSSTSLEINEVKNQESMPVLSIPTTTPNRADTHIPTAFNHPAGGRFSGTYPPASYDPYSQHYPAAPNSTPAYPPGGAPGYATYGGPAYNTDYAHMYSAFHGPPPAADPYMHRGYAPTSTHPSNYYAPFPHPPPPPYPNYSFLPPYPNPNMPSESQPPAQ